MRRRCLVLLAAALSAAGCGSQHRTATHAATASSTTKSTAASRTDCNTLGINPTHMGEGTCTHAGITYVIVDENHTLKLHTLTASLRGLQAVTSLSGAEPAAAQGKFVIASVRITNRLELPQTFDRSGTRQAEMILAGTIYPEDARDETKSAPRSCLAAHVSLAPKKSEVCDVVFAVPTAAAARLGRHGSGDLYLVDFGSDLSAGNAPQVVGQIRLYH
jgi:hypothetical protein